jgi:hypothetical protein
MKKTNIAKALFPLMLLGSPAIAGGSSVRSGSRFRVKKAVVQSSLKSTAKIIEKKEFQNPFGVFESSKTIVKKTKDIQNNVLAFLNKEGLLQNSSIQKNSQSGDRKNFATEFPLDFANLVLILLFIISNLFSNSPAYNAPLPIIATSPIVNNFFIFISFKI